MALQKVRWLVFNAAKGDIRQPCNPLASAVLRVVPLGEAPSFPSTCSTADKAYVTEAASGPLTHYTGDAGR